MKKSLVILTTGLLLMTVMTGCGTDKKSSGTDETPGVESTDTASGSSVGAITMKPEDVLTLGNYKGLEITEQDTTVTEEQLKEAIDGVIQSNVSYEQLKEGTIKDGDTVNIDFVGTKDGKEFEGGNSKASGDDGYNLVIGSDSFIPGFEDGLIGVKVGEEKDLNLTFPESYSEPTLAGQDVVFHVTVNYLQGDEIVPEWNDEFVASISDFKTTAEYEEDLKANLLEENKTNAQEAKEQAVLKEAVNNATIKEYPEAEVANYGTAVKNNITQMATYYGFSFDEYVAMYYNTEEAFEEQLDIAAKQYIAEKYLLMAVVEKEGLIPEGDYDAKALEFVKKYDFETVEDFEATYGKDVVKEEVYREVGLKFLLDNAVITQATPTPSNESTEAPSDDATEEPSSDATQTPSDDATEAPSSEPTN